MRRSKKSAEIEELKQASSDINTNLSSDSTEEPVKKRRKRRTKEELEAERLSKIKKDDSITSFKNVTKGTIWDLQENDVFRLLKKSEKEADFFDCFSHYISVIKSAFEYETYSPYKEIQKLSLGKQGFKLGSVNVNGKDLFFAVKKKTIKRVTDFSYENIRHISAAKMLDVISNNFGGGWDSLSQSIKDIIESGFDISTTTLPATRLKAPGGMYEHKVSDGFDVLEIPKGTWVEAIFAKVKPIIEIPKIKLLNSLKEDADGDDGLMDDEKEYPQDIDMNNEEVNDMTEDNYRTIFAGGGGVEDGTEDEDVDIDTMDEL